MIMIYLGLKYSHVSLYFGGGLRHPWYCFRRKTHLYLERTQYESNKKPKPEQVLIISSMIYRHIVQEHFKSVLLFHLKTVQLLWTVFKLLHFMHILLWCKFILRWKNLDFF